MAEITVIAEEKDGRKLHFRQSHFVLRVIVSPGDSDADLAGKVSAALSGVGHNTVLRRFGPRAYVKLTDPNASVRSAVDIVRAHRDVDYALPDLALKPASATGDIDDVSGNWALVHLNMEDAWAIERGSEDVVIGVIDSGIPIDSTCALAKDDQIGACIDHEDFDGDRFYAGQNYVPDPPSSNIVDEHGHGTNMAGIIAAAEQNSTGIVGMNHVSPVYVCRVTEGDWATYEMILEAIDDTIVFASGSNVAINISLNFEDEIEALHADGDWDIIVRELKAREAVICCCAGNGDEPVRAPAACASECPNVVSVGGIRSDGSVYEANYGGTVAYTDAGGDSYEIPVEISVAAPAQSIETTDIGGSDAYETNSGTSEATAFVTGLVSLMMSRNPHMAPEQIVQCLKNNCTMPVDTAYTFAELTSRLGAGVVNPVDSLTNITWSVVLETPSITFDAVAAGYEPSDSIVFSVTSCADIPFKVTVDGDFDVYEEGASTALTNGTETTVDHPAGDGDFKLNVIYPLSAPDDASGSVTVVWNDNEPTDVVNITGTRVAAGTSAIMLSADKSGSMGRDSGIGDETRLSVLDWSSRILVDLVEPGSAIGINGFDASAHDVSAIERIDPDDPTASKNTVKRGLDDLTAGGGTSIGAGLADAQGKLDGAASDTVDSNATKAIIVLSDGEQTASPYVEDVLADLTHPIFAIGMGAAETVDVATLESLTSTHDLGYELVTGVLDDSMEYTIAKYYAQILATINGDEISDDPINWIQRDRTYELPFDLTRSDTRADLVVMMPDARLIDIGFIPPGARDGEMIDADAVTRMDGDRVSRFRFDLPLEMDDETRLHQGRWRARLSVNEERFSEYAAKLKREDGDVRGLHVHGIRHAVMVHLRSAIRLKANINQSGFEPGSDLFLSASLTENGIPITTRTSVTVRLLDPGGNESTIRLQRVRRGNFEAETRMTRNGVYRCRFIATGLSRRFDHFRREFELTAGIAR